MRRAAKVDGNHAEIVKEFRRLGARVEDVHQLGNWVDLQIIYRAVHVHVEIKILGKGLEDHQQELKDDIESHGGKYATIRSVEEARELISSIYEHTPEYKK